MMVYMDGYNPLRRRAPVPRPDFVIQKGKQIVALLDAKYRDLWEHSLPRDMLYQLVIYALNQKTDRKAVILYPTMEVKAKEQRIEIRDPIYGSGRAEVVLRPIDMGHLAEIIGQEGRENFQTKVQYAHRMTWGN